MNNRHREHLSTRLVTTTTTLIRYLVDKSTQARKIVQWIFIAPMLRDSNLLYTNVLGLLDGYTNKETVIKKIYSIQYQTVLIGILERDNRNKILNQKNNSVNINGKPRKKKKQYGFDFKACAYIDELCDDLINQVCAYANGQNHKPYNRG